MITDGATLGEIAKTMKDKYDIPKSKIAKKVNYIIKKKLINVD